MLGTLLVKLGTYTFVKNTSLMLLAFLAEKTENKLDDKIIAEVKEALD